MISQGGTIARFIAHECGLQGKDDNSRLIADMVFDALMDVRETVIAPMYHARDDEAKQVEQDSLVTCVSGRTRHSINVVFLRKR